MGAKQHRCVFITGGTGYIGSRLIPRLLQRGHAVRALVRSGSEKKLPPGSAAVSGNALDSSSDSDKVTPADTFVQLVGVAHPVQRRHKNSGKWIWHPVWRALQRQKRRRSPNDGLLSSTCVSIYQPPILVRATDLCTRNFYSRFFAATPRPSTGAPSNFLLPLTLVVDPNQHSFSVCIG